MSSSSTQLAALRGMGIYEPFHQMNSWGDAFRNDTGVNIGSSTIIQMDGESDKIECVSHELGEPSRSDQEANRVPDKIQRRLAQNREAARKSRLRKKAYVQQLESSRLKLEQLEQELERARQQGLYRGSVSDSSHLGLPATRNSDGISAFEIGYGFWVEEQYKQVTELRNALQVHITDVELRILVENGLNHYNNLFQMKAEAAKADVFYLISGKWKTSVERFFLWIGGFRPSELLHVLMSQLEPLTEHQVADINHLRQSSQQAEDALSQGIEKLQQNLAQSLAADLKEDAGSFRVRMGGEIEKLEALEGFVNQADHLRQQTLQQMYRILTTHQAARGLLALGEYFYRLRALSSLWAARPRDAS